jgi:hypothetical protein
MPFSPHVDPDKLQALMKDKAGQTGYERWLDAFIIPLMQRVGLTVDVKHGKQYVITVKFPS